MGFKDIMFTLKVVRVVVLTFRNLIPKSAFAAQMIDLGLPQIVQSLKAQAWSDEVTVSTLFKKIFLIHLFKPSYIANLKIFFAT
jgi:V-ATPase subunit H